jgi:hypothetical protein
MPIKFRCNYCRQFLGISRQRAGGVVDCPSCGRTIRVPDLDGNVAALDEPGVLGIDSHLARALDELAALIPGTAATTPVRAVDLDEPNDELPQPLPEPVPLEIALPELIAPIALAPPVEGTAAPATEGAVLGLAEVLQELARGGADITGGTATASPVPAIPRGVWYWLALAPTLAGVLGVATGLTWGNFVSGRAVPTERQRPIADQRDETVAKAQGRIRYQDAQGVLQPDVGACVLLLPTEWTGESRIAPIGLRAADHENDREVATAVVMQMGGAIAWTDDAGEYVITLPTPGTYGRLILSRLNERPVNDGLTAEHITALQPYLSDPALTLGLRAFHWQDVQATTGENIWDHAFLQATTPP